MGGKARTPTLTALLCLDLTPALRGPDQSWSFYVWVAGHALTGNSLPGLCRGPWNWVQAGAPPKPSIWADPGPMVTSGSSVTIWCQGSLQAEVYHLYRDRVSQPCDTQASQDSSNKTSFSIESTSSHTAGLYQCAYNTSRNGWSERSDSLPLVVTGMYEKPFLSVQPGPSVSWGVNVTLQCRSEIPLDTFHLSKEGSPAPPQHLRLQDVAAPFQANFTVSPVTSDHEGTYRCYGSNSTALYLLSLPSDPLELRVSGELWAGMGITRSQKVSQPEGNLTSWRNGKSQSNSHPCLILILIPEALIGVSVAFILLLSFLLLLLLFIRHRRRGKHRTSVWTVDRRRPAVGSGRQCFCPSVSLQQGPQDEDPQGVTYAQVNRPRSRLRQGVANSPSPLSEESLDMKDRPATEDRQMDRQVGPILS
ncbi:hypothetical protein HPG69_013929 [Diceros bicornis minor]|uniref:Ig-like domain-containing protein n=1 Tax=Diceros bicornis minor TaxID=77932 RepID=A0A7J7EMI2_DICBM|nr:hypothetical protein HPG69_013929 [Diceros bicornis minor]